MNTSRMLLICVAVCALAGIAAGPFTRLVVIVALLLFGPGALLVPLLAPRLPLSATLTVWAGASVSLVALLYQWVTVAGGAMSQPIILVLALGSAAGVGWRWWNSPPMHPTWAGTGLALVVGVTGWTRLEQMRDLVAPPWLDAVHHALLVRVAMERGQMPLSVEPYLPLNDLAYHWGYHVFTAAVGQLAALPLHTLLLWEGQVLGALHALALGGAAHYFWRRANAAIIAAVVVGVVSIMPAYFLSWGRYTLLLGLLILPAVMIAADLLVTRPSPRHAALLALLMSGLSLVHIVACAFGVLWCVAVWLTHRRATWLLAGAAIATIAATVPWLLVLAGQTQAGTGSAATHVAGNQYNNGMRYDLLWAVSNEQLLLLTAVGALLLLWRHEQAASALMLWCGVCLLATNPVIIGLPYLSFLTNEMLVISMFVPITLLIGGGAAVLAELLPARVPEWALIGAIVGAAVWFGAGFRDVVRADTITTTSDDLTAISWATTALPDDASVLVNTRKWQYDVDRGADGGWWLLPLAGRQVSTPPVIFNYGEPTYVARVKEQTHWLRDTTPRTPDDVAAFMKRYGYQFAYASERGPLLTPALLGTSSQFVARFHTGDVTIYELAR